MGLRLECLWAICELDRGSVRGDLERSSKGQQDRRWARPAPPKPAWGPGSSGLRRLRVTEEEEPYAHLRVTDEPMSAKDRFAVLEGRAT